MPEPTQPADAPFDARAIARPDPSLQTYYLICSLFMGPVFFIPYIPLYFKYITLRYKFDDEGVSMSWGILFRKEVVLTYRRIQDIHLTRNLIQRWMGLATVAIQTASGNAKAEMSIEGILRADELRDFLYKKMRGARDDGHHRAAESTAPTAEPAGSPNDEALILLREIRDSMARLAATAGDNDGRLS